MAVTPLRECTLYFALGFSKKLSDDKSQPVGHTIAYHSGLWTGVNVRCSGFMCCRLMFPLLLFTSGRGDLSLWHCTENSRIKCTSLYTALHDWYLLVSWQVLRCDHCAALLTCFRQGKLKPWTQRWVKFWMLSNVTEMSQCHWLAEFDLDIICTVMPRSTAWCAKAAFSLLTYDKQHVICPSVLSWAALSHPHLPPSCSLWVRSMFNMPWLWISELPRSHPGFLLLFSPKRPTEMS